MTLAIGFTGTRRGMQPEQRANVARLIRDLTTAHRYRTSDRYEAHHGDCVGADAQFHELVCEVTPGAFIVVHPSLLTNLRAHCAGDEVLEPRLPLVRNKDIVLASTVMIAAPAEETQQPRGGTWATVEMARRAGRPLALVLPSGAVSKERLA